MNLDLNSHTLEIPCPNCGKKFQETIGRLKHNPEIRCSGCGSNIRIDADELRQGIQTVENSLADLQRQLGNLFK